MLLIDSSLDELERLSLMLACLLDMLAASKHFAFQNGNAFLKAEFIRFRKDFLLLRSFEPSMT
jgi:hypothetical protein